MYKSWLWLSVFGCGISEPTHRIEISEHNELGVVALTSERSVVNGERLYLLEALDAGGAVVARVQQRIGHIADLDIHAPGPDDVGTEQIIGIADQEWRGITRERNVHTIPLLEQSTRYRELFTLDAVQAELAEQQTFVTFSRQPTPSGDRPLTTGPCNANDFLVTPVVEQCCGTVFTPYPGDPTSTQRYTEYKPKSGNNAGLVLRRERSPYGVCKSWNGGACDGTSCYYGPNGSSMPTIYTNTYDQVIVVMWGQYGDPENPIWQDSCGFQTGGEPDFGGDTVGTFPRDQGCPGGNMGWGLWDY